jgi:hypothetical protein
MASWLKQRPNLKVSSAHQNPMLSGVFRDEPRGAALPKALDAD